MVQRRNEDPDERKETDMKQTDCFACVEDPRGGGRMMCMIITRRDCTGCSFYKSKAQFDADAESAAQSLSRRGLEPAVKTLRGYWNSGGAYEKQIMSTKRRSDE